MEFFTGGEPVGDIDWTALAFDRSETGPPPPQTPPLIDSLWRPAFDPVV